MFDVVQIPLAHPAGKRLSPRSPSRQAARTSAASILPGGLSRAGHWINLRQFRQERLRARPAPARRHQPSRRGEAPRPAHPSRARGKRPPPGQGFLDRGNGANRRHVGKPIPCAFSHGNRPVAFGISPACAIEPRPRTARANGFSHPANRLRAGVFLRLSFLVRLPKACRQASARISACDHGHGHGPPHRGSPAWK